MFRRFESGILESYIYMIDIFFHSQREKITVGSNSGFLFTNWYPRESLELRLNLDYMSFDAANSSMIIFYLNVQYQKKISNISCSKMYRM